MFICFCLRGFMNGNVNLIRNVSKQVNITDILVFRVKLIVNNCYASRTLHAASVTSPIAPAFEMKLLKYVIELTLSWIGLLVCLKWM